MSHRARQRTMQKCRTVPRFKREGREWVLRVGTLVARCTCHVGWWCPRPLWGFYITDGASDDGQTARYTDELEALCRTYDEAQSYVGDLPPWGPHQRWARRQLTAMAS